MIQYYFRLGLRPGATETEIRVAFRGVAKTSHPDTPGGNAVRFARFREAYDALLDPERRESFERVWLRGREGGARPPRPFTQPAQAGPGPQKNGRVPPRGEEQPIITRLMSIALPRDGRVLFEKLNTRLIVDPTTPKNLWETTLRKFGTADRERLANHLVQIQVTGPRDQVRSVKVLATDLGVHVRPDRAAGSDEEFRATPIVVKATVPLGTALLFRQVEGGITVGDVAGPVRARLEGSTLLRAGSITGAGFALHGHSRAVVLRLRGQADVLAGGFSRALLDGQISSLRTVLEDDCRLDVLGNVQQLLAEVGGRGLLHAKNAVTSARCITTGQGLLRINELKGFLAGGGTRRFEVLKKPIFAPLAARASKVPA